MEGLRRKAGARVLQEVPHASFALAGRARHPQKACRKVDFTVISRVLPRFDSPRTRLMQF